jgi:hypothetical protein
MQHAAPGSYAGEQVIKVVPLFAFILKPSYLYIFKAGISTLKRILFHRH